ncbi:MAG TPA: tyrosinase family protein [Longimicrobiaceae bacterium]|nr:tyrosinase family protein [Longimicrobiaceae bacterium]
MADAAQTRYARVKEILDRAAAGSAADYGGAGAAFWNLPLEQLKTVTVHGVRMVADEPKRSSCCCSGGEPSCARSAASGLVQGLRGEAPFDGSRFPPLPWGGARVAPDDVDFIARWIDDGLPPDDREQSFPVPAQETSSGLAELPREARVESVVEAWEAAAVAPNEYAYARGELRQRMNVDCMSEGQKERLREAFRALYELNRWPEDRRSYNNLALIHQNHCQHGWERFLPWHRVYLYEFEQALQDHFPDVTMPYWDWTMPQYRPECPDLGWRIPRALQAYLTDASIRLLERGDPALPTDAAQALEAAFVTPRRAYFTSQTTFFARTREVLVQAGYGEQQAKDLTSGAYRERFIDALLLSNSLWYPLRFPGEYQAKGGKPITINQRFNYHYPSAEDVEQIMALRTFRDFGGGSLYNDSFGFLDQNPHNTMHLWTGGQNPDFVDEDAAPAQLHGNRNRGVKVAGRRFHTRDDLYSQPQFGDMFSNLTASYDPVFWPVHANVDRLWWEWQQLHPHADPADLGAVLTPWSYTMADTLDIARFGYEYVKSSFLIPVGLETPVGRFVSRPIDVPEAVRDAAGRGKVEVRLHRVPQLVRSCFIRVFLNLPDANADTPIDHANYAGYLAVFGHGPCIGGPGHCEVPERRPYDLRPRSHNTPRNHRVDVSKTARRLLAEGAASLRITLVVIGVDYCEDDGLLRMDGVSLNFLD